MESKMLLNEIGIEAIRSKVEHGNATNDDCKALMEYLDEIDIEAQTEEFTQAIACAVESAIDNAICQSDIVSAVQRAIERTNK
jgi:hypothetical protein